MTPLDRRHTNPAWLALLGPHTRAHAETLLKAHPGLVITSTYRDAAHNRRVGGVPDSFHVRRRAVDFIGPLGLLQQAAKTATEQRVGPRCSGPEEVLIEFRHTARQHLHVAW